eukprot:m51a1_g4859 putative vacuolar protein sorting-associated protein 33a (626) ;mRNA; r:312763-315702
MSAHSGAPGLANAPVNLLAMREFDKAQLVSLLQRTPGTAALAIDPKILGYVGMIIDKPTLNKHGVTRICKLEPVLDLDVEVVIYILRPKVTLCRHIVDHVVAHRAAGKAMRHVAVFVPRRTLLCDRVLDEGGALRDVQVEEFAAELVPLEDDVVSMELGDDLRECRVDGDRSALYYVARAVMKLQATYGIIPHVRGKGALARQVADMMVRMRREMGADEESQTCAPEITQLILLDRECDPVTPLLTQLTYEGMIDELLGIASGHIDLDYDVVVAPDDKHPSQPGKKTIFPLNNNDRVFAEMRNMNCSAVGPYLRSRVDEINAYYKAMHDQKSVKELADWMKRLKAAQGEQNFLRIHTSIAEKILAETQKPEFRAKLEAEQTLVIGSELETPYIEDCICRGEPLIKVLRLLALQSLTGGGLKPKAYEQTKRDIVHAYGYDALFTLRNLERLGLLRRQDGKAPLGFAALRKSLRLVVDDVCEARPNDIAYAFSGYAPLSVRLVEAMARPGGMRAIDDALRCVPGPAFEFDQQLPPGAQNAASASAASAAASAKTPVTLVFYIGGVTFAEVAALRYLGKRSGEGGQGMDFLVATTRMVNGRTLVESLLEFLPESPIPSTLDQQQQSAK